MIEYIVSQIPGAIVGFIVAAFTPAVGRTIKSWFTKETTTVATDVTAEAKTVSTAITASVATAAKKV